MFYIKLNEEKQLEITNIEPIYRGDNLSQKIVFLVPQTVDEIEIEKANLYLIYLRADGTPDIVSLSRSDELYNETYYQYTVPVTSKMSKYAGEVCMWLHVFAGTPSNAQTFASGECVVFIQDVKEIPDMLDDNILSALNNIETKVNARFEEVDEAIGKKADDIQYTPEDNKVQLTSEGVPIGEGADISEVDTDTDTDTVYDDSDLRGEIAALRGQITALQQSIEELRQGE